MGRKNKGDRGNYGYDDLMTGEIVMPIVAIDRDVVFPGAVAGRQMTYVPGTDLAIRTSLELLEECYLAELPVAALCHLAESAMPLNNFFHTVSICRITDFSLEDLSTGERRASFTIVVFGRGELLELLPHKSGKGGDENAVLAKIEVLLEPVIGVEEWDNPVIVLARQSIVSGFLALAPLLKQFAADLKKDNVELNANAIAEANKFLLLLMRLPSRLEVSNGAEEFMELLQNFVEDANLDVKLSFFEALTVESRLNAILYFIDHSLDKLEKYFYLKDQLSGAVSGGSFSKAPSESPKEEVVALLKRTEDLLDRLTRLQNKGGSDGSGKVG